MRTSITDRRIPRSWSKTDSVPKRTSDLEHGQRASLETGRGWRAKSVRHGRKPPPDARRIFRATRFRSETAIPAPGGAASRDLKESSEQPRRKAKPDGNRPEHPAALPFISLCPPQRPGPGRASRVDFGFGCVHNTSCPFCPGLAGIDKPDAPAKSLSNPGITFACASGW